MVRTSYLRAAWRVSQTHARRPLRVVVEWFGALAIACVTLAIVLAVLATFAPLFF